MTDVAGVRSLAREAQARVRSDQLGVHAGSLTYGAFLAIPPMLVLGLSVLSIVLANDESAQQSIINNVTTLVPGLEQVLGTQFNLATAQQLSIGILGVLALLWAVSSFAVRLRTALGVIFRTGSPTLMSGRVSGTGIGLLAVAGFALYASAWPVIGSVPLWIKPVVTLVMAAAGVGLFLLIYWALTPPGDDRPSVLQHLPGACAFLVMGIVVELAGKIYVTNVVARSTALYGAIGAIFGLLSFLYIAMWALLLGAEISQIVREGRAP
jgi:uncharacterized BrkB/YihY/UPF0761 family membrane protein